MRPTICLFTFLALGTLIGEVRGEEYKSAKVVKVGEKLLITLKLDKKTIEITAFPFLKGYGQDGKELDKPGEGLRVFKEGNVLDIKTESMKLTGRAQDYISEAHLVSGELQTMEVLRKLARPIRPKTKRAGELEDPEIFTVVEYKKNDRVLLHDKDGKEIRVSKLIDVSIDADGKTLPKEQRDRVLATGNIIQARVRDLSNSTGKTLKEVRLIRGQLRPLEEQKQEKLTHYKAVVLKKFGPSMSIIEVDGKEIPISQWQSNSKYFDAAGKPISGATSMLATFTIGSNVDVTLGEPFKDGRFPIRELRLVKKAQ